MKMEALRKKRAIVKGKTTRLTNSISSKLENNELDVEEIQVYKEQINELWSDLNNVNTEIILLCKSDEDIEPNEVEYDEIATKIEKLKIQIAKASKSKAESVKCSQIKTETSTVRLPRIELPTFSGNFTEWLSFRDIFTATIHNNPELSDVQRLQYLKLSLKPPAATLIQAIQITEENYKKAWKLVSDRFENKCEIINATLDKLFSQPSLNQESAVGLRRLLDATTQCLDTLEILKQPVKEWDTILVYILKRKLDSETLRQWTLSLAKGELSTYKAFHSFIENRASALASLSSQNKTTVTPVKWTPQVKSGELAPRIKNVSNHYVSSNRCLFCKSNSHAIYKCAKFLEESVPARREFIKANNICNNCLKQGHFSNKCNSSKCKECNKLHNTLLHEVQINHNESNSNDSDKLVSTHCSQSKLGISNVLLPTAEILVFDSRGKLHSYRAILDSGSEASFIRESCVQELGLQRQPAVVNISGVSSASVSTAKSVVQFSFTSHSDKAKQFTVDALVLPKITCNLPQESVDVSHLQQFKHLKLADEQFFKTGPIDILLGADIFPQLLLSGKIPSSNDSLTALETVFGWIVLGKTSLAQNSTPRIKAHFVNCSTEFELTKFWDLEEVPDTKHLTSEEILCEKHFYETYSRDSSGRFIVKLPFKETQLELSSSRHNAERRLQHSEKRFRKNSQFSNSYKTFMNEYLHLGHMEPVSDQSLDMPVNGTFYLPHHAVVNSLVPNKFRVVFDASAKSISGVSLNDILMVGPRLQDDLTSLLLRFRLNKIAMTADIVKMYRQVKVHPDHADFQRIIWRDSPEEPMTDFRLLTVTYGTASAPYLAVKCLQQLAIEEGQTFPKAARIVQKDFYVDDMMTGADTVHEAIDIQRQVIEMLKRGGFEIKKWSSNEVAVLQGLPPEYCATGLPLEIDSEVKTLGVYWNPKSDTFLFKLNKLIQLKEQCTKRSVLSHISRLFDPLGWISPVMIKFKLMIQQFWKSKFEWDENLPSSLQTEWINLCEDLNLLENINIPRYVMQPHPSIVELHGFCDASEKAYAAVVYLRTVSDGNVKVQLLMSKTKVAPIKVVSLPRLELSAALLLSKLLNFTCKTLQWDPQKMWCWSDSMIVLAWLASHASRWKTFVANRVAKIHELLPNSTWYHIPGDNNPADCASRGISASNLMSHNLWWQGPDFLSAVIQLPDQKVRHVDEDEFLPEERKLYTHATNVSSLPDFILNISSFTKLIRVTAWICRFQHNSQLPANKLVGCLTSRELHNAVNIIVRLIQRVEFPKEMKCLSVGKPIDSDSKLLPLNLFLDSNGVMRVGGRLGKHSSLSYDHKHPMLLPKDHDFTRKVIDYYHVTNLHAGPQLTLSLIRQQFWFVDGRSVVRKQLKKCIRCFKFSMKSSPQLMGDLPPDRIQPITPFATVGVDFAGPVFTKCAHKRSVAKFKSYICLFVCTTTKAVHLELVSELSTAAFLASLRRFIARRGCPCKIMSDNGSNFKGASRHLQRLCKCSEVQDFSAMKGIEWSFIPPYTPHFGGLWESAIKSAKLILVKTSNSALLNFEEFYTLLLQIEACLNSRPLTELSSDPSDVNALSPAHFLVGGPMNQFPEPSQPTKATCISERWRLIQRLRKHFWDRWTKEYLHRLQPRSKWWTNKPNLQVGDLVIVHEEHSPPLQWTLGRITKLFPGSDQKVRVVTVKTKGGELKRTINKLYPLPKFA